jgi:polyphosphate kinase 2 (PPK2 family)
VCVTARDADLKSARYRSVVARCHIAVTRCLYCSNLDNDPARETAVDTIDEEVVRRIRRDLSDSYDEEFELELEDRNVDVLAASLAGEQRADDTVQRRVYFRELFRLQAELVKLQEWVVHTRHKAVVLFEGRDSAGKGGVIKRIMQRLNPRVCRVVALPAPNDRERTQWYFQRYAAHLPAAGEIVLFDRSWYNRASVERVMAFAPTSSTRNSSAACPNSSACWRAPASS